MVENQLIEKNLKSRIILKHDTEENWEKATNFFPKRGEFIIYDVDNNHTQERFKIGDGITNVNELPFIADTMIFVQENVPQNAEIGSLWLDTSVLNDIQYAEEVGF